MVSQCAHRGHRRFPFLPGSYSSLSSRSPPRPGPVPRRPMVRPRTDPGTKRTATAPTPRSETGLRTGPVPRPVLSTEKKRPSHPLQTNDASSVCSLLIPVSKWPGTPYKSSTACTRPTISKAPSKRSTVSGTSTTADRYPSTTTPWTPSSTGQKKSSTGTTIAGPTDPSKASTTSYKPSAEPHTGSPTPTTTPPEAYY